MPERLKGTGCKPVGSRLRWFKSNSLHHPTNGLCVRGFAFMMGQLIKTRHPLGSELRLRV